MEATMSEMKEGDLVSVLTPHGEFVGRLEKNDDTGVHLSNPKMMVSTKEGNMGFARGVCMTGEENPKSIIFRSGGIILVTPSNQNINKFFKNPRQNLLQTLAKPFGQPL